MKKRSDGEKRDRFMCRWKPYLCYFSERGRKKAENSQRQRQKRKKKKKCLSGTKEGKTKTLGLK